MPLLALRCTPPASSCIARLQRSALLGLVPSPARDSRPLCIPPPSVSACARAFGFTLLETGARGRARVHGAVITHVPQSSSTAAQPKSVRALLSRQRPRLLLGGRILTARQAGPLEWPMAFTPATCAWPNPSFEATSQRPLCALCAAPQLKRWAPALVQAVRASKAWS